jgi:glycosyltransferase involved in cell wall biosynthesis
MLNRLADSTLQNNSMIYLFLLFTFLQLTYWLLLFSRLIFYDDKKNQDNDRFPPVSVIICAHNEAKNLAQFLPYFLEQEYPTYEVIVVDDYSVDNSSKILLDFQKKYTNLRVISLQGQKSYSGKKAALEAGIGSAAFDILLLSDADCYPASPYWIQRMQSKIRGIITLGLGFSPYEKRPGFLNAFIRFETIQAAIQYLSMAVVGFPYMGVGRNLVYKKSLFREANGFRDHYDLASGDDDLFVNATASKSNTTIILDPSAYVISIPKSSYRDFYYQKSRHLQTGKRYKPLHQLLLGGLSLSHFSHYLFGIVLILLFPVYWPWVLAGYSLRIVTVLICIRPILRRMQQTDLLPWIPLLDVSFVLYYVFLTPAMIFGNTNKWN